MIKLGITGNIASGKSLVETFLIEKGFPVIDADKIVHSLLENDRNIKEQVICVFEGFDIFKDTEKQILSRNKIGKIAFHDRKKLKKLEEILHPAVKIKIEEFFEENKNKKLAAACVPLLFEAGMEDMFDYIVFVGIDPEIQLKRLIERNNLSEEEAKLRINSQIPQGKKAPKADFIIDNSGTKEETLEQLRNILVNILQRK